MIMDFNDRLRNQLHTQSDELQLSPEGTHAVRTRSRKRQQRRIGGTVLATVLIAMLAGGWILGRSGDTEANLATEGESDATSEGSPDSTGSGSDDSPVEMVLPNPGAPLVLSTANNETAPGGYNVFQSGRSGDLYYVLSTAPGLTYDDLDDGTGVLRNDTVYTFDGSEWSQSSIADRFVSTLDATESGLLYTVSTGTPAGPALELGTSSIDGLDWSWTELDLSSVFGPDRSTWPPYSVQYATQGTKTLVVVHTQGQIDWAEAAELAAANGASIDPDSAYVMNVDQSGITWVDNIAESNPCLAALDDALNAAWADEPEGPEFDFDRELTDAEQAELEEYWNEQDQRAEQIYIEALQSVARVPGCAPFVKCTNEHATLQGEFDDDFARIYENGGDEFTEDEVAELDALMAANTEAVASWARTSGCDEVVPHLLAGEDIEGEGNYASWNDLGVEPPDSWKGTNAGFLVDDGVVTSLGSIFGAQDGYLVQVAATGGGWTATFDVASYNETAPAPPSYTIWTSADGIAWTSTSSDSFNFSRPVALSNGTAFTPEWNGDATRLLRVSADGTTNALTLSELAPDLDTTGYQIMNVRAGDYGAVAWAIRWQEVEDGGQPYDSIVLYSPDGVDWGATAVPDVEVVDVIVGDEEVVLFLNDPDRPDGAAQPIMIGRA